MTEFEPVPAMTHIAQQHMRARHGWWGIFRAWIKGAHRG